MVNLIQMELAEFMNKPALKTENSKLINVRGCNGSGKSTIVQSFKESDPGAYEVLWEYPFDSLKQTKPKVLATVFPNFHMLALGSYKIKTGGLDTFKSNDETASALDCLWDTGYDIIMEGVISSTIRTTYVDLFNRMLIEHKIKRHVIFFNLLPPVDVCIQRVLNRNGGKPIKENLLISKYKTIERNASKFEELGFTSIKADNSEIVREETLSWFLEQINKI